MNCNPPSLHSISRRLLSQSHHPTNRPIKPPPPIPSNPSRPSHQLLSALQPFDEIPQPDIISYNALLSALRRSGDRFGSFRLFLRMTRLRLPLTGSTLSTAISSAPDPLLIPQIHTIAIRSAFNSNTHVGTALIAGYANLKDPNSLHRSFNEILLKNSVTWTAVIIGLMDLGLLPEAQKAFDLMPRRTTTAYSALLTGYIANGEVESARKWFDRAAEKNTITWTAMISGYNRIERFGEALNLFVEMDRLGSRAARPNGVTYSAAMKAAAGSASFAAGSVIHGRILKHCGPPSDPVLATSVIDAYGRCGDADGAIRALEEWIAVGSGSVAAWNAAIGACAKNGRAETAAELFDRMLRGAGGIRPDRATFAGILTGFAHEGRLEEGSRWFERMEREFGMEAGVEHYGCLVDLYGRAGRREEAARVVERMGAAADEVAEVAAEGGRGLERRMRECGERGEWGRVGELKEERERAVAMGPYRQVRGVSLVESLFGCG